MTESISAILAIVEWLNANGIKIGFTTDGRALTVVSVTGNDSASYPHTDEEHDIALEVVDGDLCIYPLRQRFSDGPCESMPIKITLAAPDMLEQAKAQLDHIHENIFAYSQPRNSRIGPTYRTPVIQDPSWPRG